MRKWPVPGPNMVGIVNDVRSLHNVGAIFRSADGAGFGGLILCGITGTPPRNEIRKAALGAEEAVPWHYEKDVLAAIAGLRAQGYQILALEKTPASRLLYDTAITAPVALIIGHEFHGIPPRVLDMCDEIVHLPMRGTKVSLNVSVAFGIAAYEISRRLHTDSEK